MFLKTVFTGATILFLVFFAMSLSNVALGSREITLNYFVSNDTAGYLEPCG